MDTRTLSLCTPICKGSVPAEEDFVNVNAIQRWQQAVSVGKRTFNERDVMTHKRIRVEYGTGSTLLWHAEDEWQADERVRALQRWRRRGRGLYISTPAFLFMPAPLLKAQGYWICLSLSERSGSTFLVTPASSASGIYLPRTRGPKTKQRVVLSQKDDGGVKATLQQQGIIHTHSGPRRRWKHLRNLYFKPPLEA